MLHEFLSAEREKILMLCEHNLKHNGEQAPWGNKIDRGLPIFYNELIGVLRDDKNEPDGLTIEVSDNIHRKSAECCGKESMKNGYTISQVVHGYGALCQAITMHADAQGKHINVREFNRLNFCLDIAIAEAVTEYNRVQKESDAHQEVLRLGYFTHELRNALGSAMLAHRLLKGGIVGYKGSTSQLLENALLKMRATIDRSLSEVRMQAEPILERNRSRLSDLIDKVETMAWLEASNKSIIIITEAQPDLYIEADEHLVISALSNLVQNAIKFTKNDGQVFIRCKAVNSRLLIEVEDQCGGLPEGKIEELFTPFVQKGEDRKGLGLGLSISRRAIALNGGNVSAANLPGVGCVFSIDLPLAQQESEAPLESVH